MLHGRLCLASLAAILAIAATFPGCCGAGAQVHPQSPEPPPSSVQEAPRLRILTWNIYMMPTWTFQSPHNKSRAAALAEELLKLDLDILCLEKAFDGGARKVLEQALASRYPYRYGPANPGCGLKINSGVWVLSRIPLSGYHEIVFRDSAGIESFSRKGAVILSGVVAGHPFQLVATHLQGEDGPRYRPDHQLVRDRQMNQIRAELLDRYARPDTPLIICGDFSTPRRDETDPSRLSQPYVQMLETLGAETGPGDRITLVDDRTQNDMADDATGRKAELDYIFLRPGGADIRGDWSRLVLRHAGWDGPAGRVDLSYRYAVGATFTFGSSAAPAGGQK